MRRTSLVLAIVAVAGCATVDRVAGPPVPRSIPATPDQDVWAAAVNGVSDADLAIATRDERAGLIQTQWVETFTRYSAASPPTRRIMFSVRVDHSGDGAQVTISPKPEVCGPTGACRATPTLTEVELAMSDRLVAAIQANLREPVARAAVRDEVAVQSGRELPDVEVRVRTPPAAPEPPLARGAVLPDREGPVMIETRRAGRQEVAAGRVVEVELVSGHRVSGEIRAVSEDGILLDLGSGEPIVLWERDIAAVFVQR